MTIPPTYTARMLINVSRTPEQLARAERAVDDLPLDEPTLPELRAHIESTRHRLATNYRDHPEPLVHGQR
jgi:hypothetical protein